MDRERGTLSEWVLVEDRGKWTRMLQRCRNAAKGVLRGSFIFISRIVHLRVGHLQVGGLWRGPQIGWRLLQGSRTWWCQAPDANQTAEERLFETMPSNQHHVLTCIWNPQKINSPLCSSNLPPGINVFQDSGGTNPCSTDPAL